MADPTPPVLPVDPATLDDDTLAALTLACRTEVENRGNRQAIPAQVASLATVFKHAGGAQADLAAAISDGFDAAAVTKQP